MRKIIAIILSMSMLFVLIVACGNNDEYTPVEQPEVGIQPTVEEQEDSTVEDFPLEEVTPLEPIEIETGEDYQNITTLPAPVFDFLTPNDFPRTIVEDEMFQRFEAVLSEYFTFDSSLEDILEVGDLEHDEDLSIIRRVYSTNHFTEMWARNIFLGVDIEEDGSRWINSIRIDFFGRHDDLIMTDLQIDMDYWEQYNFLGGSNVPYDIFSLTEKIGRPGYFTMMVYDVFGGIVYEMTWLDSDTNLLRVSFNFDDGGIVSLALTGDSISFD